MPGRRKLPHRLDDPLFLNSSLVFCDVFIIIPITILIFHIAVILFYKMSLTYWACQIYRVIRRAEHYGNCPSVCLGVDMLCVVANSGEFISLTFQRLSPPLVSISQVFRTLGVLPGPPTSASFTIRSDICLLLERRRYFFRVAKNLFNTLAYVYLRVVLRACV